MTQDQPQGEPEIQPSARKNGARTKVAIGGSVAIVVIVAAFVIGLVTHSSSTSSDAAAASTTALPPGPDKNAVFTPEPASPGGVLPTEARCADLSAPANREDPAYYDRQYQTSVVDVVSPALTAFVNAAGSGDPTAERITARTLSGNISSAVRLTGTAGPFGCYNQALAQQLEGDARAATAQLDELSTADAKTDVTVKVDQVRPLLRTYVSDQNAYGAQFGGAQIPVQVAGA